MARTGKQKLDRVVASLKAYKSAIDVFRIDGL